MHIECVDTVKCIMLNKDDHYFVYVIYDYYVHSYIFLFKDNNNIQNRIKDKIH